MTDEAKKVETTEAEKPAEKVEPKVEPKEDKAADKDPVEMFGIYYEHNGGTIEQLVNSVNKVQNNADGNLLNRIQMACRQHAAFLEFVKKVHDARHHKFLKCLNVDYTQELQDRTVAFSNTLQLLAASVNSAIEAYLKKYDDASKDPSKPQIEQKETDALTKVCQENGNLQDRAKKTLEDADNILFPKKAEEKKPEDKKADDAKPAEDKKADDAKPAEDKKADDAKPAEDKKADDAKPAPDQNAPKQHGKVYNWFHNLFSCCHKKSSDKPAPTGDTPAPKSDTPDSKSDKPEPKTDSPAPKSDTTEAPKSEEAPSSPRP